MGDLTRNLSRKEFECNCGCGFDTVDYELVLVLQNAIFYFENYFKKKVIVLITGGNRCKKHNIAQGGAPKSKHIDGKAADHKFFTVSEDGRKEQIDPEVVYSYYDNKYPDKYGLGKYENRTHIDSRARKARW